MAGSKLSIPSWVLDNAHGNKEEAIQFVKKHKWEILAVGTIAYLTYKVIQLRKLPPGPYGLPVIGRLLHSKSTNEELKLRDKYGDIASVQFGQDLQIWLNTSKLIKEVFVNRASEFSNRPVSRFVRIFNLKDHIFSGYYNDEWTKNKKCLMSAFKKGLESRSFESSLLAEVDEVISSFEKLQTEAGSEGICLKLPLRWMSGNLICNILFSGHYEMDNPEMTHLMEMVDGMFEFDINRVILLDALPEWLGRLIFRSDIKELSKRPKGLRKFFRAKIDEHEATRTPGEPRDFIDAYLDEMAGPDLDYIKMVDSCVVFLPDSVDSIPLVIEWVILYVSRYPNVQALLHKELDDVVGRSREPLLSDKPNLNYLKACILETYRLVNFSPTLDPHLVERNAQFAGYTFPKGATIHGNTIAINFDPALFPNPEKFRPERHLKANGKLMHNEHIMPFGVGPRTCVGQPLSKMEVFVVVAKLFQTFEFSFPLGQDDSCLEGECVGVHRRPKDYKLIVKKRD